MIFLTLSHTLLFLVGFLKAEYQEVLSRGKLFPLAAAAYSDSPGDCVKNKFKNAKIVNKYKVPCGLDDQDLCFGYLALLHDEKAIVLSFRGSMTKEQIIREGVDTLFKPGVTAFDGVNISFYFYTAFIAIWSSGMETDFQRIANTSDNYGIWMTGHSLGGAMASICAAQITFDNPKLAHRISLYTYGQPRVGDLDFANFIDNNIPDAYRIIHNRDIVANVPLIDFNRFWHHKTAVIYNQTMNIGSEYTECDKGDIQCTVKHFGRQNSVDDHMFYYGIRVFDYGLNGCRLVPRVRIDVITRDSF